MILISPVTDPRLDPPQNVAWSLVPPRGRYQSWACVRSDGHTQIPLQLTAQYNVVLDIRYKSLHYTSFQPFLLCRYIAHNNYMI